MIAEPIAVLWTPACMDADELAGWHLFNDRAKGSSHVTLPCADCLPGFAAEMRSIGRCNGTPRGGQEDEEMGTFDFKTTGPDQPNLIDPALSRGLSPIRRVELDIAAPPCASCAHEPVCALRAAFEGMATVETAAPPLPDGLRLTLSASVECSHFLRDRAKPAPVRVMTPQERGQANGAGAKRTSYEWTPEQRAAAGDRMRARNAARPAATG